MRHFRCFLIDETDAVESFMPLELEDEAEAVRRAEAMLRAKSKATSAEIWESGHLIAKVPAPRDRT